MIQVRQPPRTLWKVNVKQSYLSVCVGREMYAMNRRPDMHRGDLLLLQVTKSTATNSRRRISYGLCFAQAEADERRRSEEVWGEAFDYLIHGRIVRFQNAFSLEHLAGLEGDYVRPGQMSHQRILPSDVDAVLHAAGLDGFPC